MTQRGDSFARPWDTRPPAGTAFGPLGDRLQMFFAGDDARDANGRMGTVVGGSWVASRFGRVRKQDRNEYVDSAATYNTVGSNAPITVAAWVNPANSDVAIDYVLSLGNTSSGQFILGVNGTNAGSAYLNIGSSGEIYTAAGVVLTNAWNSIVFVFGGGGNPSSTTAAIYVNGVKQSLTFASMSALSVTASLTARLYSAKFAGERHFRGMVGPVGIWSRAIGPDEVAQWHANPLQVFEARRIYIPTAAAGGGSDATATLPSAAATSAAGTISATGGASVSLTGAAATSQAGTLTATGGATASITGASTTAAAGQIAATGGAVAALVGASATAAAGIISASAAGDASVTLPSALATAAAGAISATGGATVTLTGAAAVAAAGDITVSLAGDVSVTLPGASATASAGVISATGGAVVVLPGASATAYAGAISAAGDVVPASEYIRLFSRITPAVALLSPICPTVARSSPVAMRRDLRSSIDLESP